ncbi:MAG: T9SS type A sorting domain-containing protein [Calditrichaeota bacterium]|nr:T9SS type A sorting domain-containing protein [Calditrichota bacterium]
MRKGLTHVFGIYIIVLFFMAGVTVSSAQTQPIKIMPLGDSITQGINGSTVVGGYRDDLYDLLKNEGVSFDFVGSLSDGDTTVFDADHEGHGGWRAYQIDENINTWLTQSNPDIILLHIGTNDVSSDQDNQTTISQIGSIIDKIYNYNSNITIVLSSLIPRNDAKNPQNRDLNRLISLLFYDKQQAGYKIVYAGNYEVFIADPNYATDYLFDEVHPNDDGYHLMAEVFFNSIMNIVNAGSSLVTDNFNRSQLGVTWEVSSDYLIQNNALSNGSANYTWNQSLAVYKAEINPTKVTVKWAANADQDGIGEGGIAMGLDAPSTTANGYFIWINKQNEIGLFTIENGVPGSSVGTSVASSQPLPQAGDEFTVQMSTNATGHHFDVYVNGNFAGSVSDPNELFGNATDKYAGVMLKGSLNNDVDDFNLFKEMDTVPPATISDLTVVNVSSSTVELSWTAPGDDDMSGIATSYDLRYSTDPITDSNFQNATQAASVPVPTEAGQQEHVVVAGLSQNTTYYFAVKTRDEVPNVSGLSNVVQATTQQSLEYIDDFNRTTLGPNWVAPASYKIVNNELANTSTDESWDPFLATYVYRKNPVEVSFDWGTNADATGIENGGIAMVLDAPTTTANGYLVWYRPSKKAVYLALINNGVVGTFIDTSDPVTLPDPGPGDNFKIIVSSDNGGNHFDCYINNTYYGRVTDPNFSRDVTQDYYAGVILHGNRNNNIDNFRVVNTPGNPSVLEKISGDNQTGTVNTQLTDPFVVRVTDENGNPVENVNVDFNIVSGGGHMDLIPPDDNIRMEAEAGILTAPMKVAIDSSASGNKFVYAPTGDPGTGLDELKFYVKVPGTYYFWGRIFANNNEEDSFFASVDGGPEALWDLGDDQIFGQWRWKKIKDRDSGEYLTANLDVGLHSLKIRGRERFARLDKILITRNTAYVPSGLEDYPDYITDANGLVKGYLTLGDTATVNEVQVVCPVIPNQTVTFTATALPDNPVAIHYVSGNNQSGSGGQALANPFVVRVVDQYGNPVPNYPVTFVITQGDGSLSNSQPVSTDANGLASTILTLGLTSATNTVEARAGSLQNSPIVFVATAESGIASKILYVSGNNQTGTVGQELSNVLKVKVVDNINEPVANVHVSFVVTDGNGTVVEQQPISTDTSGFASVHFILGTHAGTNTIEAQASGLANSPIIFTETGLPDVAKTLTKTSGDQQSGIVSQLLKDPLVVTVTDQYGNAVAGQPVLFTVTEGGGEFQQGGTMLWDTTGTNGIASVQLKLGPLAGTNNNKVKVESTGLQGSPLYFVASASPANAAKILYVSGNDQIGYVNQALAKPFVVKVTDATNNPVKNHPVIFHVKKGDGTFVESSDVVATIPTDANGLAEVTLKLGPIAGANSNEVWATSTNGQNDLENSPIKFNASSKYTGQKMAYVSGNHQSAVVMSILPNPLKVKITDANGKGVSNHPVTFKVEAGGGKLNGSVDSLVVLTSDEGIASVQLRLGPNTGQNNNIVKAYATNGYDSDQLENAPVVFEETALGSNATTLVKLAGGDNQTGVVGENLPHKIQVKVTDKYGNVVAGHPVTFSVIKGGGSLANSSDTVKTVNTNSNGIAEIEWKLGPKVGTNNNQLQVSSTNGVNPLQNSPLMFTASSVAGKTDPDNSTIVATGPVPADGNSVSTITVTLYDRFMNPVPGKIVTIEASGTHNFISGPSAPTDANGQTTATLSSISAGKKVISAKDQSNNIQLNNTAEVLFVPGEAKRIVRLSGDQQVRNVGTILADSLVVQVTDDFNNPVPGVDVTFSVKSGGGIIIENQPVKSDSNGNAYIHYILGDQAGENQIQAESPGLLGSPIFFTETGVVSPASQMSYVLGNQQTGIAGKPLAKPFKVFVSDRGGSPVKGVTVTFRIILGKGHMTHDQVTSDAYGMAASTLVLAPEEGSNIVNAEADGLDGSPVTFVANGVPGTAEKLLMVSGDNQAIGVGNVSENMVVRAVDGNGNPVQGVTVHFEVTQGDASLITEADQATNVDGLAFAAVRLGTQTGPILVNASSDGLNGSPVTFHIQALSAPAETLLLFSGDKQNGTVGSMLPFPIQVKVVDHYDNPVPNYPVTFVVTDGGGSFRENQPVQTNSAGIASVNWIMGSTPGNNTAMAVASGLQGSPVQFTVQAFNNNLPSFTTKAPDLTVIEKQNVHFVIEASDPDGDPLSFAIMNKPRGATLDSISYTQREFKWTPDYDQAGTYKLIFIVYDDKGGADRDTSIIVVENKNRLPIITAFLPEKAAFSVKPDSVINFSITAEDPDSDPLSFFWEIDGKRVAEGAHFQFTADSLGHHSIIGYVADPYDTTFHQWNLNVKTRVELESFVASSKISNGLPIVALQWVTRSEEDNIGFNVYRSRTKNGRYKKITTEIIRSNSTGRYDFEDGTVVAGYQYYYKIEDVDLAGHRTLHGPVRANVALPQEFHLSQNYPNPFNPETTIRFTLPKSGHVQLVIFNLLGQKVRTLLNEDRKAGFYNLRWDGRDEFGNAVPSGIYYYSIKAGAFHATKRMILAR